MTLSPPIVLILAALWVHFATVGASPGTLLAPWVVAVPVSLAWLAVGAARRGFRKLRPLQVVALAGWAGVTGLTVLAVAFSRDGVYATAVAVAYMANGVLALLIVSVRASPTGASLQTLNRHALAVGVVAAVSGIALFLPILLGGGGGGETAGPGWILDRGVAYRMVGFVGDPNFFALYATIPLAICLYSDTVPFRPALAGVLAFAVLLTLSRSGIVAILLVALAAMLFDSPARWSALRRRSVGLLVAVAGIGAALSLAPVREAVVTRVSRIGSESRFNIWSRLDVDNSAPIFGSGVGESRRALGRYTHNTFLDLFYDQGALALLAFVVFLTAVSIVAITSWRSRKELRPWVFTWFVLLLMLNTFSMGFNPFLVLVAGLILRFGAVS